MASTKTILVCEPHPPGLSLTYLPWLWGLAKTHWEHQHGPHDLQWLDPICKPGTPASLLQAYRDVDIDVLMLSCHSWNWRLQDHIAERVKTRHPRCLVVASGPEADYENPRYFSNHLHVDLIAIGDAEVTLSRILEAMLGHDNSGQATATAAVDFSQVPGLYLPQDGRYNHVLTGSPSPRSVDFAASPYLAQSGHYVRFRAAIPLTACAAVWQTSPASACSWERYWGGIFGANDCHLFPHQPRPLQRFSAERLTEEVEWLAKLKAGFVSLIDDDFSCHEQDALAADWLIEANARHGFPFVVTFKTPPAETPYGLEIAAKLQKSRIGWSSTIAVRGPQADSSRLCKESLGLARKLTAQRVPLHLQLTMGVPGDSHDGLKTALATLMEHGLHASYRVSAYRLSRPPRPAASQVQTQERYLQPSHGAWPKQQPDREVTARSWLVVQTESFTRNDWIQMKAYADVVTALHCGCITDSIARYLRLSHAVPYREFYGAVVDEFCCEVSPAMEWYDAVVAHYNRFLADPEALDFMPSDELSSFEFELEPDRWLMFKVCFHMEAFFNALGGFLASRFPRISKLNSLVEFQKNIVVMPHYDAARGKLFFSDFDWVSYFGEVRRLAGRRPAEPRAVPGGVICISDVSLHDGSIMLPLDLGAGSEEDRWVQWIHRFVVGHNMSSKNNHQKLRLHRPAYQRSTRDRKFDA